MFNFVKSRTSGKNSILFSIVLFLFSLAFIACDDEDNIVPTPNPAPLSPKVTLMNSLKEVIEEEGSKIPGFSIAIVKNGTLAFQESFGYADLATEKPYTNQTTQPIGSISKTFIGAAIVKAIEEGYFTLETAINDLLPVALVNPKNPNEPITVKHLVTHTSGLLDNGAAYNQSYYILPGEDMNGEGAQLLKNLIGVQQRTGETLEELMGAYYLEDGDLYAATNFSQAAPGQVWNYSNFASSLAAFIVENATGKPFDEYVTEKILQPLGMTHTSYETDANGATLYFDKNTPLPLYANDSYPDGSINTSNEDLSKYLLDMMQGATGNATTLFSKAGYEMLFTPLLPEGITPPFLGKNQGVFWVRNDSSISHDGSDPGLSTVMQFFEDGQTGFLLLTNMDASVDENEAAFQVAFLSITEAINAFINAN